MAIPLQTWVWQEAEDGITADEAASQWAEIFAEMMSEGTSCASGENLCDVMIELLQNSNGSADVFLELLAARLLADCAETLANAILDLVYG